MGGEDVEEAVAAAAAAMTRELTYRYGNKENPPSFLDMVKQKKKLHTKKRKFKNMTLILFAEFGLQHKQH